MKYRYPAHAPIFSVGGLDMDIDPDGPTLTAYRIPLTPAAAVLYVDAGGTADELRFATEHRRGRKPSLAALLADPAAAYILDTHTKKEQ